ncbi:fasciclin-2-like [Tachypleus tridentatus]|uniref:fasciclin-2-like n=1 Tax=Tachypleus tridentatus TaxID=6853 RepID=UPI003FCFD369
MWKWISLLFSTIGLLHGCFAEELRNSATLSIQPEGNSQSRPAGESFAVTCMGTSENDELFSDIKWEDPKGNILDPSVNDLKVEVKKTSESTLSLVFVDPQTENSGQYTCKAFYNSKQLETAVELTFFHDITWNDCPKEQALTINQEGKIQCKVSANPSPKVSWVKLEGGHSIDLDKSRFTVASNEVSINKVQEKDGGKYRIQAMVTETGRFKHRDIIVEVYVPPNITDFQEKVEALEETVDSLKCWAEIGNPAPWYSWFDKNDILLGTQERFLVNKTTGILSIKNIKKEDAGTYTCVAENVAGQNKKQLELTVLSKPNILQFENGITVEGKSTSLECRASGVPPPKVSIRKEGVDEEIKSGERMSVNTVEEKKVISLKMTINQVQKQDGGLYFCYAENVAGSVEKPGHLTVEFKPQMKTPESKLIKTWNENPVNLSCIAEAIPNATVKWYYSEQEIKADQSETYIIYGEGGYSKLLVTPSSEFDVYGFYKCEGINEHGKDNITIQLDEAYVPGKLSQVDYKEVTSTTISFEFLGDDDGGLPISSYLVEYREESDAPENFKIKEWPAGTTYILESLKPRATYIFRFAAKNAVGTGTWLDKEPWKMPEESAPDPPTIISPTGNMSTYPDKMDVQWNINHDNGKPITFFQIRYFKIKKQSENKWKQDGQDKVINIDNDSDEDKKVHFTLTELEPHTYYKVELRAKNEIGFSQDETMIFRTAMKATASETAQGEGISTSVIVAVVVVLIVVILIVIDVTFYFYYHWGVLYFLRHNLCGEPSESKGKETVTSDEEKGSKKDQLLESKEEAEKTENVEVSGEDTPMIDSNNEKKTKVEESDKNKSPKGSKTSLSKGSEV